MGIKTYTLERQVPQGKLILTQHYSDNVTLRRMSADITYEGGALAGLGSAMSNAKAKLEKDFGKHGLTVTQPRGHTLHIEWDALGKGVQAIGTLLLPKYYALDGVSERTATQLQAMLSEQKFTLPAGGRLEGEIEATLHMEHNHNGQDATHIMLQTTRDGFGDTVRADEISVGPAGDPQKVALAMTAVDRLLPQFKTHLATGALRGIDLKNVDDMALMVDIAPRHNEQATAVFNDAKELLEAMQQHGITGSMAEKTARKSAGASRQL